MMPPQNACVPGPSNLRSKYIFVITQVCGRYGGRLSREMALKLRPVSATSDWPIGPTQKESGERNCSQGALLMNNDHDAPEPKARMVVSSKPCPLGLSLDTADVTLPSTPPGRTLTKLLEAPPGPQKDTLNSPPMVGTPLSRESPTRDAPAARAARLPAPWRKADARSRQALSEMSPLARGADGPGVCGKFLGRMARSNDSRRSCRLARKKFWGQVWSCGNGSSPRVQPGQHPSNLI